MKLRSTALGVVIGGLLAGGLAFGVTEASATGPNTVYYACLNKGKLSHVGTARPICPSTATVISWNSQGPAGTNGISHVYGKAAGAGTTWNDTINHQIDGSLSLPAGSYAVTAHVEFLAESVDLVWRCFLYNNGTSTAIDTATGATTALDTPAVIPYKAGSEVTLTGTVTSPGSVQVSCQQQYLFTSQTFATASITAVAADNLN